MKVLLLIFSNEVIVKVRINFLSFSSRMIFWWYNSGLMDIFSSIFCEEFSKRCFSNLVSLFSLHNIDQTESVEQKIISKFFTTISCSPFLSYSNFRSSFRLSCRIIHAQFFCASICADTWNSFVAVKSIFSSA